MTPSLEYVCRALCRSSLSDPSRSAAANDNYVEKHWPEFEAQSRRLLETIQEPHADMVAALERACFKHAASSSPWSLNSALKGWRAAIQEPLR